MAQERRSDGTIQLTAGRKTDLILSNPIMPAAGCYGFGPEYSELVDGDVLGAVVVGPVTARPRRGAAPPRLVAIPGGGALLHTGLDNPGIGRMLHRHASDWAHLSVPVIVHVAGTTPHEAARCCQRLTGVENVVGIELGLADSVLIEDAEAIVQAARSASVQPLIVRLPLRRADELCSLAVDAGADALTVGAPPRGTAQDPKTGSFVTGRLYGRFVFPLALRQVRLVLDRVSVPVIGCGGVYEKEQVDAMLESGAAAVQVGAALWEDPSSLGRLARSLSSPTL